jgi:hypothetical protein
MQPSILLLGTFGEDEILLALKPFGMKPPASLAFTWMPKKRPMLGVLDMGEKKTTQKSKTVTRKLRLSDGSEFLLEIRVSPLGDRV